jgi:hypothetical protein
MALMLPIFMKVMAFLSFVFVESIRERLPVTLAAFGDEFCSIATEEAGECDRKCPVDFVGLVRPDGFEIVRPQRSPSAGLIPTAGRKPR